MDFCSFLPFTIIAWQSKGSISLKQLEVKVGGKSTEKINHGTKKYLEKNSDNESQHNRWTAVKQDFVFNHHTLKNP